MKHIKSYKLFEMVDNQPEWLEMFTIWNKGKDKSSPWHYQLDDFKKELEESGEWNPEWTPSWTSYRDNAQEEYFTYNR